MKQKLLALAATLAMFGAGTIVFLRWESGTVDAVLSTSGEFEFVDIGSCTTAACNANQCIQAQNVLQDAGSACIPRFADCDFRISQKVRNLASDAGVALGPQKYQRLRLVALRCPGADGGSTFGIPFSDAGWPVYAVAVQTPLCVRAPLDGGTNCRKSEGDGGFRFFGKGNVFPASQATGAQCEPTSCSVFFGDNPDTSL